MKKANNRLLKNNENKVSLKNQNHLIHSTNSLGITLIALVITIIVLLILAGVSIAMLTGQNGILTQAQNTKQATTNKSTEEKINLAVMAARTQSETGALDINALISEITNNYGGTATKTDTEFPLNVTVDGNNFIVNRNGIISKKPELGDEISLTSTKGTIENFYILSYNEKSGVVRALAKYNLKVGQKRDINENNFTSISPDEPGYGLQDKTMKGWEGEGKAINGVLTFSKSKYWEDTTKYQSLYVYDANSILKQYVDEYKQKLLNTDKLIVFDANLISYEEIPDVKKSEYPWLVATSYWGGSAVSLDKDKIWIVNSATEYIRNYTGYNDNWHYGIRPVITINMSGVQQ